MLDTIRPHFDDDAHLARFLGVTRATLCNWDNAKSPRHAAHRLLLVLAALAEHAPATLAHLVRPYRKPAKPARWTPSVPYEPFPFKHQPPVNIGAAAYAPFPFHPPRVPVVQPEPVYYLAAFKRGEYDHLMPGMDDEEYERWRAKLV